MGFQKGKPKTGGRQLGQPNKVSLEIKEYARAVVEDPTYQAKLKERLLDGSAPQLEVLLHYYAYGRPRQEVDVTQNEGLRVIVYGTQPAVDVRPASPDHSTGEVENVEAS